MTGRHERPLKRRNPGGGIVWVARWTDRKGKRRNGWKPDIAGTHALKRDAQTAIDACYEREAAGPVRVDTVGGYFATWTDHHPRSEVTNATNESRIRGVLDVELDGVALRDWRFDALRRRHATALVAHMLVKMERARVGVVHVLGSLSAMTEDAIEDEVAIANPWRGVRVKANDPRIVKPSRPVRVWSWQQMHEFARESSRASERELAEVHPALLRTLPWRASYAEPFARLLSDCGLRIGEAFGARRADLDLNAGLLELRQTVSATGEILPGTKTDHGQVDAGRVVPVPPELCVMLDTMLKRIDTELLFADPKGRPWRYSTWARSVWLPAVERAGIDPRPHEFRHSFVTHMRAAPGVDDADLADIAGHSVATMHSRYAHSLGRSHDAVRRAVGS